MVRFCDATKKYINFETGCVIRIKFHCRGFKTIKRILYGCGLQTKFREVYILFPVKIVLFTQCESLQCLRPSGQSCNTGEVSYSPFATRTKEAKNFMCEQTLLGKYFRHGEAFFTRQFCTVVTSINYAV